MTERIQVTYQVHAASSDIDARARGIALEQTVELPEALVPPGFIADDVVGRIEDIAPDGAEQWRVRISYHPDSSAHELTQLLNVMFGNTSIQTDVRLEDFQLPASMLARFKGPRFGIDGIRSRVGVATGPLLQTALKPMGTSSADLAKLAYQFALGGVDIVKDDHGLSNQPWSPFRERVEACVAAVAKANRETGGNSLYAPNVTAGFDQLLDRALFAKQAGAGALLIAPGLVGLDAMRCLAEDDRIGLPIIAHPAFFGGNTASSQAGFSHRVMYGLLPRLCGADSTVYPNYGGRFGFSREQCLSIVQSCLEPLGNLRTSFPTPGGGMTLERIGDMQATYGDQVMYLMGGGLYGLSPDLTQSVKMLLKALGRSV